MKTRALLLIGVFLLVVALLPIGTSGVLLAGREAAVNVASSTGSMISGTDAPSKNWYFAAGSTTGTTTTFITVANTGSQQATVDITYCTSAGQVAGPTLTVGAGTSSTVNVADSMPDQDAGAIINSSQPVIAKRTISEETDVESNLGASSLSETLYFADGVTDGGFHTSLALLNPGGAQVTVTAEYGTQEGSSSKNYNVPSGSMKLLDLSTEVGVNWGVTTKLESTGPIAAERIITSDSGVFSVTQGLASDSKKWYFPPVTTQTGFDQWLVVWNDGDSDANTTISYCMEDGSVVVHDLTCASKSRYTLSVANQAGADKKCSILVESDDPVVCELPSYWNNRQAGSISGGSTQLAKEFYVPGDTVGSDCEEWICLANFGSSAADISLSAATSEGTKTRSYSVPRTGCKIVNVNQDLLSSGEVYYVKATSSSDFLASGALFYGEAPTPPPPPPPPPTIVRQAAHDSIGVTEAATEWFLAVCSTANNFETWVLIANPGAEAATVTLTFFTEQGEVAGPTIQVGAHSRQTVEVAKLVETASISTRVTSDKPVVAERAMYYGPVVGQ